MEEEGCFFEGLQPLKEGGREYDLTFVGENTCWLKFTKPAAAGYVVSFESGPAGCGTPGVATRSSQLGWHLGTRYPTTGEYLAISLSIASRAVSMPL